MTYTDTDGTLRIFSFGGGVQSTAALVLAAAGEIDYRTFLFAETGADSENPATMSYMADHAHPFAERHGIDLIHVVKQSRAPRETETLYQRLMRPDLRGMAIPAKLGKSGLAFRACTVDYKIAVVNKWLKKHGATAACPALVGIGISLDEFTRARRENTFPFRQLAYPLLDLRLTRMECKTIIAAAGLPEPPESSCWFCPNHTNAAWQRQHDTDPELFARSVALEQSINQRRSARQQTPIYFHNARVPLPMAVKTLDTAQDSTACPSNYCGF